MKTVITSRETPNTRGTQGLLPREADVVIVGAGFSGIATAVRLRRAGFDDLVILESGGDVGGTWRDNTYPGCACDVPSHLYSLSFAPNPDWSSTFSPQPEIYDYLRRVARDQRITPLIRFGTELLEAAWHAADQRWKITTNRGEMVARVLITAAGPLSEPSIPDLPGLGSFQGAVFHSARWDHSHSLAGERVAVIGTGASAIQFVPQIQPDVARLYVFQRTPPWVMPRRARSLTRAERIVYQRVPVAQRAMRNAIYAARELFAIPLLHAALSPATRRLATLYLHHQVRDPQLRGKLTPSYAPGCKRILISDDYYPSLQHPNVEVTSEGISEVREHSVVTPSGVEREVDAIIFATGFHVTDLPIAKRLRGIDGRTLDELWDGSPQAYRGTTMAGYPNLFTLLGPNTGLGHNSVVLMAEAQARYITGALRHMRRTGAGALDVRKAAQTAWNETVQEAMVGTVWTEGGCASWYIDRSGRNSTLWPDFSVRFRLAMRRFDNENYLPVAPRRRAATLEPKTAVTA